MDSRQSILIVVGAIACIGAAYFTEIYYALIVLVIVGALYMTLWIMQDSAYLPQVSCSLSEDAKTIIVKNTGTASARRIHVSLVPLDIEFDIKELQPEEEETFTLEKMIHEAKAVVRFSSAESDNVVEQSYPLSSLSGGVYDPLKPTFPLFSWKK